MSNLQRGTMLTAVALMLAGAVVGCNQGGTGGSSSGAVSSGASVATVNGTPITQADFYQQLQVYRPQGSPMGGMNNEPAGTAVLRQMIQTELIEQLAKKDGVYPTDAEVDQQYQDLDFQNSRNSTKTLDEQLQLNGLTPDYVKKNQIIPQLCQLNEVTKGVTVTDADIKAYYDLHKTDQFTDPDQAHIKRIQAATQADAQDIYDQLQKGGSWDQLYNSTKSTDKSLPGGDVPQWINMTLNNPQAKGLIDAIKKTDAGKYAPPFQFGTGFWVIQVVAKRPKQTYPLDKVKDVIRMQLLQQKVQTDPTKISAFQEAMRDKQTTADIKVNEPQYQPLIQQITNPAPPQQMAPPPSAPAGRPGAAPGKPGAPAPAAPPAGAKPKG
jgi:parvulin-like peptidyl-prolyl isomerase